MDIQTFDNFLPEEILVEINQNISQHGFRYGWQSINSRDQSIPYAHWNNTFAGVDAENGLDLSNKLDGAIAKAWEHIRSTYCPGASLVRCYMNAHTYGVEGYPHTDTIRNGHTVLVYLNDVWKREWGGETMFYDKDTVLYAELPKRNKGLIFDGKICHVAKGVTRLCPSLRVTLMFKITKQDDIDSDRDRLQEFLMSIKADTGPHANNSSLLGHLLRTYDYLKAIGQPQYVCNAGAIHSIFGTNLYQWKDRLDYSERDRVAAAAGEDATRLAEIFSKVPRPAAIESALKQFTGKLLALSGPAIEITQLDLNDLAAIEGANLRDQSAFGNHYPMLKDYWTELNNK